MKAEAARNTSAPDPSFEQMRPLCFVFFDPGRFLYPSDLPAGEGTTGWIKESAELSWEERSFKTDLRRL